MFLIGSAAMAIEKSSYEIKQKNGNFELRLYDDYIVAETIVTGDFEDVGNEGFRRLYKYISGHNRKKQSISMTAPVNQEADFEKIAMTAPVGQEKVADKWRITFLMPSKYTLATLPEPLDERVALRQETGRLMAAVRYSGSWSREKYRQNRDLLELLILKNGLKPIGPPVWARYDPPFMPWFLRRNEVLIPVLQSDG
jgi:hypothetical protein